MKYIVMSHDPNPPNASNIQYSSFSSIFKSSIYLIYTILTSPFLFWQASDKIQHLILPFFLESLKIICNKDQFLSIGFSLCELFFVHVSTDCSSKVAQHRSIRRRQMIIATKTIAAYISSLLSGRNSEASQGVSAETFRFSGLFYFSSINLFNQ